MGLNWLELKIFAFLSGGRNIFAPLPPLKLVCAAASGERLWLSECWSKLRRAWYLLANLL